MRHYNYEALRGGDTTDQDVVDTMGLDPALANTPEINDAMLKLVYDQNINAGVSAHKAYKNMMEAKADIQKLIKQRGWL